MKRSFFVALFLCYSITNAQDPIRFQGEVNAISTRYDSLWDSTKETIVFTGSSSIRIWENLPDIFPGYQIVNSGFGGSQASDLLAYTDELILQYNPSRVFIYEGDNDIFSGKSPRHVIRDTREIIKRIKQRNVETGIVLIAAKPSIVRWHLKGKYKKLNRKFRRLSRKDEAVEFANIWDTMLAGRKVRPDLFIADGLHMNSRGYELWYPIIKQYVEHSKS